MQLAMGKERILENFGFPIQKPTTAAIEASIGSRLNAPFHVKIADRALIPKNKYSHTGFLAHLDLSRFMKTNSRMIAMIEIAAPE